MLETQRLAEERQLLGAGHIGGSVVCGLFAAGSGSAWEPLYDRNTDPHSVFR